MKHILLLLLLTCSTVYSQPSSTYHLVSRLPEGPCYSVAVDGNLACVANGSALDVIRVGNQSAPKRIGRVLLPGIPYRIRLVDSLAYVADGAGGLVIVDLTLPDKPKLISSIPTNDDARSVDVSGSHAFVAHISGFTVFDISNPHYPEAISTISTVGYAGDLALQNDSLYLAAYDQGVLVYDIHTPSAPTLVRQVFLNGSFGVNSIRLSGPYVFATSSPTSGGPLSYGRFHVLNLALLDSVPEIGAVSLPGDWSSSGGSLCLDGSIAYVAFFSDAASGICTVSIDSISSPKVIGRLNLTEPHATEVADSTLFVADGPDGLQLYGIQTPSVLIPVSNYATKPSTYSLAVSGPWVYLGMGVSGIRPVDLSVPQEPVDFGTFTTGQNALFIDVSGAYAFTTSNYGAVDIADISREDSIFKVGFLETIVGTSLKVRDSLLYVTDRDSGLFIANVSDPLHPFWLGHAYLGRRSAGVALSGMYAYVAAGSAGVRVVDVLDPNAPKVISTLPTVGYCFGVAVSENRALVADGSAGLRVFDISDPQSPVLVSTTPLSAQAKTVACAAHYAYVGTYANTTFIVDYASDPVPRIIDSIYTGDSPNALASSGDLLLVADLRGGLYIFQNDLISGVRSNTSNPVSFHLKQNYPNPFNSSTIISYELPQAGDVAITIYSLLGQKCETLFKGHQESGQHSVTWQASHYSSGIYFYSIQFNGRVVTKSAALVK